MFTLKIISIEKVFQLSGSGRSGAALRQRLARNHDYLSPSGWVVTLPQAAIQWFWAGVEVSTDPSDKSSKTREYVSTSRKPSQK